MSHPVISVENLSKTYRLGQIGTGTLTNDLKVWWARKRGKPNPLLRIGQTDHGNMEGETLWALRDVSFDVEQGEVLGIIGRNGAGKSTLLKILSRVTAPTSGQVKVKGRIASLLEVGTGFHPDLTGRENIYLNGAILGMTREEVRRKFDEIVAFAEIEKFIDTPVKRYSSGMYVRLAFAVAAHLESEILLVDEVLAVGDAEFQKKCLGKMGDVATNEGRTVLFVSHNMAAVTMLCKKGILIDRGIVFSRGEISYVIREYSGLNRSITLQPGKGAGIFRNVICSPDTPVADSVITVIADMDLNHSFSDYYLFLIIKDENSNNLVHSVITGKQMGKELVRGLHKITISLPPIWLKPGNYSLFLKLLSKDDFKDRIDSEPVPINVNYQADNTNLQGLLNPSVIWDVDPKN